MSENQSSAQPQAQSAPAEVCVANSRQIDFTSSVNGREYRIQVALPSAPAPEQGHPVLYVLDGFAYFASAADCVRFNANAPHVAVVGIGYPSSPSWVDGVLDRHFRGEARPTGPAATVYARRLARSYDLTLPASDAALAAARYPGAAEQVASDVGGVADFLKTIETDIRPRISAMLPVDPSNQVLFGHSFGGLAALHALFTAPQSFGAFIIASPSIWWNERAVLAGEPAFRAAVASGAASPRVLVTMGALEGRSPSHIPTPAGVPAKDVADRIAQARMVENARDLTARLQTLAGRPPFHIADYLVFPDQGHGISAWSALAAGVAFAFQGARP